MRPPLADLDIDHAARTVRLRHPPERDRRGRKSPLDPLAVAQARYAYLCGGETQAAVGARLGVSQPVANRILNFERLAHV